jgi:3-hydroxyisobutyrate dehydrogenase
MAKRLIAAGFELTVFDVAGEAALELAALGARVADGPARVAEKSDIVLTSLPNPAILTEVVSGALTGSLRPGALVVDLSTVDPETARNLAKEVEAAGGRMVDAPVSGGVAGAESGRLTIMVGGDNEDVKRAEEALKHLGEKILHVGGSGSGQAMKIVNNLLLGINMAAVAEAMTLGVKLGLDPEIMANVASQSSGASYALSAKAARFILAGNFAPGFAVDLQYKDLDLALAAAGRLSFPSPMGSAAKFLFEIARAGGRGREDVSAVIKFYEEAAGTEVRGRAAGRDRS